MGAEGPRLEVRCNEASFGALQSERPVTPPPLRGPVLPLGRTPSGRGQHTFPERFITERGAQGVCEAEHLLEKGGAPP